MRKNIFNLNLLTVLLFLSSSATVLGAPQDERFDARQQQRQTQQNKALEKQQVKTPEVHLNVEEEEEGKMPTDESPCYTINEIILTDFQPHISEFTHLTSDKIAPSQFNFALKAAYAQKDLSLPACIGGEGINVLLRRIQNELIEQGYVTTRVVVQPQDLTSQRLVFTVIVGTINRLQIQDASKFPTATAATRWFAMPMNNGDILNIRDLEQGLENLRRNTSAQADVQIEATDDIGKSDVVVTYQQTFPIHLTLGLDDSGSKSTGKLQASTTLSWDNFFSLNDLFYASFTKGIKRDSDAAEGDHGSKNFSLYYSVPWKNWLLTLSGSEYTYFQTVAGAYENYEYSGKSKQMKTTLGRLLYRDRSRKTFLSTSLWSKQTSNFVNDTEVEVQRRRMAGWETSLTHTEYLDTTTLQFELGYKRGTGARGAIRAPEELFDEGSSRPRIITTSVSVNYPFALFDQPLRFYTNWSAQWNKSALIPQDRFSIGGRYTVRGFDGELTLSGERGWLWRNEVAWNIAGKGHELYLGIDKGTVRNRYEKQLGNSLVGGVIGLRGKLWGLNYEYFVGTPLDKPKGFKTSHAVTGFNLSYRF
jgi:fhaC protein